MVEEMIREVVKKLNLPDFTKIYIQYEPRNFIIDQREYDTIETENGATIRKFYKAFKHNGTTIVAEGIIVRNSRNLINKNDGICTLHII